MSSISRRSVAKGAAWSIPAVAVANAAPSIAASSLADINCPAITWTDTGLKSYAVVSGTKSADTATYGGSSDIGMGSMLSMNLGQFGPNAPADSNGSAITGFKYTFGDTAIVRTAAGKTGTGTITAKGTQSVQVIGAPIQENLTIQTGVPYKLVAKKAANYVVSLSIPFTVQLLDGLSNTHTCSTGAATQLWYNVCYPASPDGLGNYPDSGNVGNSGAQWNVTITTAASAC